MTPFPAPISSSCFGCLRRLCASAPLREALSCSHGFVGTRSGNRPLDLEHQPSQQSCPHQSSALHGSAVPINYPDEAVAPLHTPHFSLLTWPQAIGHRPTSPKGLVYLSIQSDHSVLNLLVDGSLHSDPHQNSVSFAKPSPSVLQSFHVSRSPLQTPHFTLHTSHF
jgi:hypothetical protein